MSASEMLNALVDKRYQPAATADIRSALPQIVAVVEAAERASEYANTGYSDKAGAVLRREAAPALAALEEALK